MAGKSVKKRPGCDMRGMLSFQILWLLSNRPMYGQELAREIERRRGEKPNPGTIYPAIKELSEGGLIMGRTEGRSTVYRLTGKGSSTLKASLAYFERAYADIFYSIPSVQRRMKEGRA
jgi:DNA-binding PadR family transcriptional regulator